MKQPTIRERAAKYEILALAYNTLKAERDEWRKDQRETFAFYADQVRQTASLRAELEATRDERDSHHEALTAAMDTIRKYLGKGVNE